MNQASVLAVLAAILLPLIALAGPVNINTADAKTLARELKGIGLARAQAIVDFRDKNGPFKNAEDLAKVKGVGMRVVEQNRPNVRMDKADKSRPASADADQTARTQ